MNETLAAWAMPMMGVGMMALGAYAAGETRVTCWRGAEGAPAIEAAAAVAPDSPAACRAETRRWFGRKVVDQRAIGVVRSADAIAVSRQETERDSDGHTRTRTVDSWSLRLHGPGVEESFGDTSQSAQNAAARFNQWIASPQNTTFTHSVDSWAFGLAAIGFGVLWSLITTAIARSMRGAFSTRVRMTGRRRRERTAVSDEP